MTDNIQELPTTTTNESLGAIESTPVMEQSATSERMISQSDVNRIVSTQKKESFGKGFSAAKQQLDHSNQESTQNVGQNESSDVGAMKREIEGLKTQFAQNEKQREDKILEHQAQERINSVASTLGPQIEAAKSQIQDFDEVTSRFNLEEDFGLMEMAASTNNGAHVLYELAKTPTKMFQVQQMAKLRPDLARHEMQKLSQSIINNNLGKEAAKTPEPLSQVGPSNVGGDGPESIADFRKLYKG